MVKKQRRRRKQEFEVRETDLREGPGGDFVPTELARFLRVMKEWEERSARSDTFIG